MQNHFRFYSLFSYTKKNHIFFSYSRREFLVIWNMIAILSVLHLIKDVIKPLWLCLIHHWILYFGCFFSSLIIVPFLFSQIMRDPETGNSRGFGFISYDSFEASDAAIEVIFLWSCDFYDIFDSLLSLF